MRFYSVLSLGMLAGIVHANPVPTEANLLTRDREYDEFERRYEQAQKFYPGIYWETARGSCSLEQFDDLYKSVESVIGLIRDMNNGLWFDGELGDSEAWSKFFMPGQDWKEQYPKEFEAMIGLYDKTGVFIQKGREGMSEKYKKRRKNRLAFVCGDAEGYGRCRNDKKKKAYVPTLPSETLSCQNCYQVAFCDAFFDLPKITSVVADGHFTKQDLVDPKLVSREHAMLHEFMHVDLIGQPWHITDLRNKIVKSDGKFPKDIYGAYLCSDYAYQYASSKNKVNYEIRTNADNYAWVISYAYYASNFGWDVSNNT